MLVARAVCFPLAPAPPVVQTPHMELATQHPSQRRGGKHVFTFPAFSIFLDVKKIKILSPPSLRLLGVFHEALDLLDIGSIRITVKSVSLLQATQLN